MTVFTLVQDRVLMAGADDWVMVAEVEYEVRLMSGRMTREQARRLALGVIGDVVTIGLMEIGDLTGPGFRPWPLPHAAALDRLEREWTPNVDLFGFVWLGLTADGQRAADDAKQRWSTRRGAYLRALVTRCPFLANRVDLSGTQPLSSWAANDLVEELLIERAPKDLVPLTARQVENAIESLDDIFLAADPGTQAVMVVDLELPLSPDSRQRLGPTLRSRLDTSYVEEG
jgi:hypothetical protein